MKILLQKFTAVLIIICPLLLSSQISEGDVQTQKEILKVVDLFFESMTKKDTLVAQEILISGGQLYASQQKGDKIYNTIIKNSDYLNHLGALKSKLQERIWNPTVLIRKSIAVVWANYDIYVDGKFAHCGVDSFSLVKTDTGWKIISAMFTREPEGCAESPLGVLKEK